MNKKYVLFFFIFICFCGLSYGQSTSSIVEKKIKYFSVFPNPVRNGKLTITTFNTVEKEVIIYNVLGKQVFSKKFTGNRKQLDISQINSGIYIVKVIEGDKVATKKLVIK